MKAQNTRINREQGAVSRIMDLYEQVLRTGRNDTGYRAKLLQELLKLQKEDGSFSVISNYRVDMDIRVAYVYEPTYYATAAMMFIQTCDLSHMREQERTALLRGLSFAEGRHLAGHGYEATKQQLQALRIYKDAGLYEWLRQFGDTSPSFASMINGIISHYRAALENGRTISDWNVDFRQEFEKEVSDYEEAMIPDVWYACYGSNMNYERFIRYIRSCSDQTEPAESRPYTIPYNLYFAGGSETWGRENGVAFIDDTGTGNCQGRIYKISRSQFTQIQQMEGSKYTKRLSLGNISGIPVYTLTSSEKRTDEHAPGMRYLQTIMKGLQETCPDMSPVTSLSYLIRHGAFSQDDRNVLLCIRNSEHAISIEAISSQTAVPVTRTRNAVKRLLGLGLIKEDSRSVRAGYRANDQAAMFYTCSEMRELISLVKYNVI